jgi:hypothetical protein
MANTFTLISSTVLGSTTSSITFSSIPQTYTDIVLKMSVRTTNAGALDQLQLILNNDTTGGLASERVMYTDYQSSLATNTSTGSTWTSIYTAGNGGTANTFGHAEIYIPNYTSSVSKPFSAISAQERNLSDPVYMGYVSSLYRNSTGITRIDVNSYNAASLGAGSSFYLYGIKKD